MFSSNAFIVRFKYQIKSFTKYLNFSLTLILRNELKKNNDFQNYVQLIPHLQHFLYSYYTKIYSIFIPEFLKIPGVLFSIPDKEFLLSFWSVIFLSSVPLIQLTSVSRSELPAI